MKVKVSSGSSARDINWTHKTPALIIGLDLPQLKHKTFFITEEEYSQLLPKSKLLLSSCT